MNVLSAMPIAPTGSTEDPDLALAERHRPLLKLDDREPFRPLAAGYTVYRGETQSVSSKFLIQPAADCVVEYAIWYDWDIQHLYDLEHVWVHLDAAGRVVKVEASRHGARRIMTRPDGSLPVEEQRPV
ncbi:MAG TPA: HAD family hydrolase, partial [Rhizobium sp.]|nr:HAD family hydrolase [Rhizobium sp.]